MILLEKHPDPRYEWHLWFAWRPVWIKLPNTTFTVGDEKILVFGEEIWRKKDRMSMFSSFSYRTKAMHGAALCEQEVYEKSRQEMRELTDRLAKEAIEENKRRHRQFKLSGTIDLQEKK